jgi:hypothetical protein
MYYNRLMFIAGILLWWYGPGWRQRAVLLGQRLMAVEDYFSIDLLLRTFFSPFRQISAGKVQGSLNVQMRALFDRLISRVIGAMIRFVMVLVGILAIVMYAIVGGILLVCWAVVPLMPVVGTVLFVAGWIPWNL